MLLGIALAAATIALPPLDRITVATIRGSHGSEPVFKRAKVEVLIQPDGRAVRCKFVDGSGDEVAAKEACRTFGPIKFDDRPTLNGSPSYAVLRATVVRSSDAAFTLARELEPDTVVAVNRLPDQETFVDVTVALAVDAFGNITACEPFFRTARTPLIETVCAAPAYLGVLAATDKRGRPIAYVTKRTVRLALPGYTLGN